MASTMSVGQHIKLCQWVKSANSESDISTLKRWRQAEPVRSQPSHTEMASGKTEIKWDYVMSKE